MFSIFESISKNFFHGDNKTLNGRGKALLKKYNKNIEFGRSNVKVKEKMISRSPKNELVSIFKLKDSPIKTIPIKDVPRVSKFVSTIPKITRSQATFINDLPSNEISDGFDIMQFLPIIVLGIVSIFLFKKGG